MCASHLIYPTKAKPISHRLLSNLKTQFQRPTRTYILRRAFSYQTNNMKTILLILLTCLCACAQNVTFNITGQTNYIGADPAGNVSQSCNFSNAANNFTGNGGGLTNVPMSQYWSQSVQLSAPASGVSPTVPGLNNIFTYQTTIGHFYFEVDASQFAARASSSNIVATLTAWATNVFNNITGSAACFLFIPTNGVAGVAGATNYCLAANGTAFTTQASNLVQMSVSFAVPSNVLAAASELSFQASMGFPSSNTNLWITSIVVTNHP